MIQVDHKGYCLKLQRQITEDKVQEVTKWLKDCAEKMHQSYLEQIDDAMKRLLWGEVEQTVPVTQKMFGTQEWKEERGCKVYRVCRRTNRSPGTGRKSVGEYEFRICS